MDQNVFNMNILAALMGGMQQPQRLQTPQIQRASQLHQSPQNNSITDHPILRALASGQQSNTSQAVPTGFHLYKASNRNILNIDGSNSTDNGSGNGSGSGNGNGVDYSNPTVREVVYEHFARYHPLDLAKQYSGHNSTPGLSTSVGSPDGRRGSALRLRM